MFTPAEMGLVRVLLAEAMLDATSPKIVPDFDNEQSRKLIAELICGPSIRATVELVITIHTSKRKRHVQRSTSRT